MPFSFAIPVLYIDASLGIRPDSEAPVTPGPVREGLVAALDSRMATRPALELFQALARKVKAVFYTATAAGDRR